MPVETVIYEPPKPDFPYLVVTLAPSGVDVVTAANRTEARTMVANRRRPATAHLDPIRARSALNATHIPSAGLTGLWRAPGQRLHFVRGILLDLSRFQLSARSLD